MSWNSCVHTKTRRPQKDADGLKQEADDPAITVEEKHGMSCIAKLKVCASLQEQKLADIHAVDLQL